MTIKQLMETHEMTIHELIDMVKTKGAPLNLEGNVISLPNDKYGERAVILFEDRYFVTNTILDSYLDVCHYEDMEVYNSETQAQIAYNNLLNEYDAKVYE